MNATEKTYEVRMIGTDVRRPATAEEIAHAKNIQWSAWRRDSDNTIRTGWDEINVGFGRSLKTIYRSAA
jgi:hypothetical protein